MSNKKDYTKFSKRVEEPTNPPVTPDIPEEKVVDVDPPIEPKHGIVTDCLKLNVRAEPDSEAEVLCTVTATDELMIDEYNSTKEFYKIVTAAGVEGFCMKRYITIIP